jgi:hypothetical protein
MTDRRQPEPETYKGLAEEIHLYDIQVSILHKQCATFKNLLRNPNIFKGTIEIYDENIKQKDHLVLQYKNLKSWKIETKDISTTQQIMYETDISMIEKRLENIKHLINLCEVKINPNVCTY